MWGLKSKKFRVKGGRDVERENNRPTKGAEKRRRKSEFRFLVVNPFSNFFVKNANRRRLENWRDIERSRICGNRDVSPARSPLEPETFPGGLTRPGSLLGRPRGVGRYEIGWQDSSLEEFGRKEKRTGVDFVRRAEVDRLVSGSRTDAEKTALELEYNMVDPCKDRASATETWDHRYQAYRNQVATDLCKQHSIGNDLFRLRKGRREVFKQLQEFGYIDVKAAVDDVFIVRGFDRLCRDVAEWRRQAIDALRLRHKQMDDAMATEDAAAAAAAEEHVSHLVAIRRHIDNYKIRIAQQLSAKDMEIERLRQQLEAGQALSFAVTIDSRPPVQAESLFTDHKVTSRVFRGCLSSDVTYWAQRTAVFPDKIREESMLNRATSNVATKADPESKIPQTATPQVGPELITETAITPGRRRLVDGEEIDW